VSHYTRHAYFERSQWDATPPLRARRHTLADRTLYALAFLALVGMVAALTWWAVSQAGEMPEWL
jgi:hypothetical protein